IYACRPLIPGRQGFEQAIWEQFLTRGVPNVTPGDSELVTNFWTSPTKEPQFGLPISRRPKQSYLRQLKILISFFTWPTDQPRHATHTSGYPVEPSSPPVGDSGNYTARGQTRQGGFWPGIPE